MPKPRLRMFAGPNGSGKSTIKEVIAPSLLGHYINPDDIERGIRESGAFFFSHFGLQPDAVELRSFLADSELLLKGKLLQAAAQLDFFDNALHFSQVEVNSYFAAVLSDFVRRQLLERRASFTFETVMSSPDKVQFLQDAQSSGYRTYLYYVATADPQINIQRVLNRVAEGGHPVPEDKIVSRYKRSLELLLDAIHASNRAYIFDNSGHEKMWFAEITNGWEMEFKADLIPQWFQSAVIDKLD